MTKKAPWQWIVLATMDNVDIVHKNKLDKVLDYRIPTDFLKALKLDLATKFSPENQQKILIGCWLALRTVGSNKGMETIRDAILDNTLPVEIFLKPDWGNKLLSWAEPIDESLLPTVGYESSRVNMLTGKKAMFKFKDKIPELWLAQNKFYELLNSKLEFIPIVKNLATLPNHGDYWSCQGARLFYLLFADLYHSPVTVQKADWATIMAKMPGTIHGAKWLGCETYEQVQLLCAYLNAVLPGKKFTIFDLSVQFCEVMQIDKVLKAYGHPVMSERNYMSICDISAEEVKNIAADAAKEPLEQKFGETYTLFEEHFKRIIVYTSLSAQIPRLVLMSSAHAWRDSVKYISAEKSRAISDKNVLGEIECQEKLDRLGGLVPYRTPVF